MASDPSDRPPATAGCGATRVLAEGENVVVRQCTCGHIHLHIGAVTLTMPLQDLFEIASVTGEALRQRPQVARLFTVN